MLPDKCVAELTASIPVSSCMRTLPHCFRLPSQNSITSDPNQSSMPSEHANKIGYIEPNEWEKITNFMLINRLPLYGNVTSVRSWVLVSESLGGNGSMLALRQSFRFAALTSPMTVGRMKAALGSGQTAGSAGQS